MNCSRCTAPLIENGCGGYDNALRVKLDGGYSEFVDTIVFSNLQQTRRPLGHILCHSCGHSLMNWLGVKDSEIKNWHPLVQDQHPCDGWTATHSS